jgi:hypothetical protein
MLGQLAAGNTRLADHAYDSEALCQTSLNSERRPTLIRCRTGATFPPSDPLPLRNLVKPVFDKLKPFRAIVTR